MCYVFNSSDTTSDAHFGGVVFPVEDRLILYFFSSSFPPDWTDQLIIHDVYIPIEKISLHMNGIYFLLLYASKIFNAFLP